MQILLWFVVCICTEVKPTFNKEVKYYFHLTQIHRSTGFSFDVREVQMKNFWWSDFFFKHRSRSQCNFIKNININKPMTIKKFILYSEALTRWLAQDSSSGIISFKIHPKKFSTKLIYFSNNEKCSESQGKRPSQLTKKRLHWLLTWQEQHTKQIKEWSKETHTQVFLTWTFSEFENVMI